jgi:hypothetical protein
LYARTCTFCCARVVVQALLLRALSAVQLTPQRTQSVCCWDLLRHALAYVNVLVRFKKAIRAVSEHLRFIVRAAVIITSQHSTAHHITAQLTSP